MKYILVLSLLFCFTGRLPANDLKHFSDTQKIGEIDKVIKSKKFQEAAQILILNAATDERLSSDDLLGMLQGLIAQFAGPEIAALVMDLSGIPEFKDHVIDLYSHIKMIANADTCPKGFQDSMEDISWIAAFAMSYYYIKVPVVPGTVALIVSKGVLLAVTLSKADEAVCGAIHSPLE